MMNNLSRRDFHKQMAALGLAALVPTSRVIGANETIRVAVLGVGRQGKNHAKHYRSVPGAQLVAVCDPDRAVLDACVAKLNKDEVYPAVEGVLDYRSILDRDDIDAVSIATPNHWHSLMSIHACQAGKHVYVEKPVSHTIWEGKQLIAAAKKYNCIVQGGTQNRSDVGLLEFKEWIKDKPLGEMQEIRGLCYRQRKGIGKLDSPLKIPSSLNYNLWLGPTEHQVLYRPSFHYDWHWYWQTGNGDFGNQGPHETNLMTWMLGDTLMPQRVTSFGGRFGWQDAAETPNIQFVTYELNNGIRAFFEVCDMTLKPGVKQMPAYRGSRVAIIVEYEGGSVRGGRGGGWAYDKDGKRLKQFKGDGGGQHKANFINAIRTGNPDLLRSPVAKNVVSDNWMHIGNISQQLAKNVSPEDLHDHRRHCDASLDAEERFCKQLANWQVDYKKEPWRLGPTLTFDADSERFTGSLAEQANTYLHRKDRSPFVVPKEV